MIIDDQIAPIASKLVYQNLTLYKTFYMEMEVFPTVPNSEHIVDSLENLIHFTVGGNDEQPGDRTLGFTEIRLSNFHSF